MKSIIKSRKAMGIEEAILKEVEERGYTKGEERGYTKGEEVGYTKGLEELKRHIVIRAWRKALATEEIAELVGTSVEEVEQIILDFENNRLTAEEEE